MWAQRPRVDSVRVPCGNAKSAQRLAAAIQRLQSALRSCALIDVLEVFADGGLRNAEPVTDLAVGTSIADQLHHRGLTGRELGSRRDQSMNGRVKVRTKQLQDQMVSIGEIRARTSRDDDGMYL